MVYTEEYYKALNKVKVFRVIKSIGCIVCAVGFILGLGTVGTSDLEAELHTILHPESWYTFRAIIAASLMISGGILVKVFHEMIVNIQEWMIEYVKVQREKERKAKEQRDYMWYRYFHTDDFILDKRGDK